MDEKKWIKENMKNEKKYVKKESLKGMKIWK